MESLLPKNVPFIYSMIGGAVSGLYLMINNVTAYTMGGLGISLCKLYQW